MTFPLITTSRWDIEDAHTLERYVDTDGYKALTKALTMTPAEVHEEVKKVYLVKEKDIIKKLGLKKQEEKHYSKKLKE